MSHGRWSSDGVLVKKIASYLIYAQMHFPMPPILALYNPCFEERPGDQKTTLAPRI